MSDRIAHLDQETLQSYLDRDLDASRRKRAEAHLSTCVRCRRELDGWKALYGELDELPTLTPAVDFTERVIGAVGTAGAPHPSSTRLQELLEGILPEAARVRIDAHVADCPTCARELRGLTAIQESLDRLPRFAPSPGFAARVVAALAPRPAPVAEPSSWDGLRTAARNWLPKSALGRKVAAGALLAPIFGMLLMAVLLVLNPLMGPRELLTFAGWRLTELSQAAASQVLQLITETTLVVWSTGIVDAVAGAPGLAMAGLVAIWAALFTSGWILYRNLVVPSDGSRRHVHAS